MTTSITLDQARAFVAFAEHGTYARAANALHKRHTAIVYALASLERSLGLVLLDRGGYRTRLTGAGRRVLDACRRLLDAEAQLASIAHTARSGWEPRASIVFDGVLDASPLLDAVRRIVQAEATTEVRVEAAYLSEVEELFERHDATLMISVVPPRTLSLVARRLAPVPMWLVAAASHPLAKVRMPSPDALTAATWIAVRGADPRLALPTADLRPRTTLLLNDFATKRDAITSGLGIGWLPGHLADAPLARGTLRRIDLGGAERFVLRPRVYRRKAEALGRAATMLFDALR